MPSDMMVVARRLYSQYTTAEYEDGKKTSIPSCNHLSLWWQCQTARWLFSMVVFKAFSTLQVFMSSLNKSIIQWGEAATMYVVYV